MFKSGIDIYKNYGKVIPQDFIDGYSIVRTNAHQNYQGFIKNKLIDNEALIKNYYLTKYKEGSKELNEKVLKMSSNVPLNQFIRGFKEMDKEEKKEAVKDFKDKVLKAEKMQEEFQKKTKEAIDNYLDLTYPKATILQEVKKDVDEYQNIANRKGVDPQSKDTLLKLKRESIETKYGADFSKRKNKGKKFAKTKADINKEIFNVLTGGESEDSFVNKYKSFQRERIMDDPTLAYPDFNKDRKELLEKVKDEFKGNKYNVEPSVYHLPQYIDNLKNEIFQYDPELPDELEQEEQEGAGAGAGAGSAPPLPAEQEEKKTVN